MRDLRYSSFHTAVFIAICAGVALLAAFGTFRSRPGHARQTDDKPVINVTWNSQH